MYLNVNKINLWNFWRGSFFYMIVKLLGSQLEDYKRKSLVGHWVLVEDSFEDLQKENDESSKQVGGVRSHSICILLVTHTLLMIDSLK